MVDFFGFNRTSTVCCCMIIISLLTSIQVIIDYNALPNVYKTTMPLINIINKSNCEWNTNEIRFVTRNDAHKFIHSLPPYLISFQGSGNTFTRLIIELISNYYTGSIHTNDNFLINAGFKGDARCDNSTIILKAHPNYIRRYLQQTLNGTTKKCKRQHLRSNNNLQSNTNKMGAIFLFRNPWDAFFSEFQRIINVNGHFSPNSNGHIHNLLTHQFHAQYLQKYAVRLLRFSHQFIETFKIYQQFKKLNRNVLLIRFENIENDIWQILEFLFTKQHLTENDLNYRHKIKCIFNQNKHRTLPRNKYIKRAKIGDWDNSSLYLTKHQFYSQFAENEICKIWNVMLQYIVKYDLLQYGYGDLVENYNC